MADVREKYNPLVCDCCWPPGATRPRPCYIRGTNGAAARLFAKPHIFEYGSGKYKPLTWVLKLQEWKFVDAVG